MACENNDCLRLRTQVAGALKDVPLDTAERQQAQLDLEGSSLSIVILACVCMFRFSHVVSECLHCLYTRKVHERDRSSLPSVPTVDPNTSYFLEELKDASNKAFSQSSKDSAVRHVQDASLYCSPVVVPGTRV